MEYTPLESFIEAVVNAHDDGSSTCEARIPRSVCVGLVAFGGLMGSIAHRAAQLFTSTSLRVSNHPDLLYSSINFVRPAFASPKRIQISIELVNSSKTWTLLQVNISQDGKLCMCGHLTLVHSSPYYSCQLLLIGIGSLSLTDMNLRGPISAPTGWHLSPPPLPASIDSLEKDADPYWVSYLTPLAPESIRNVQAYVKWYLPIERHHYDFLDQWVTPGWNDSKRPNGAVWTNELMHFMIDNNFHDWPNHVPAHIAPYCRYEAIVAAGLEQRKAREEGRSDRIFGEGCGPVGPMQWVGSSVYTSTEVKKLLPKVGVRWLFMHTFATKLENNRIDEHVYVLDTEGDVVAINHHHIHIIPYASKLINQKMKL